MHDEKSVGPNELSRSISCNLGDMEEAHRTQTLTERGIKSRHAQMIAIGTEHELSRDIRSGS